MKIAVTGAHGQLGSELCRQLGTRAVPLARRDLDLTDLGAIADRIVAQRPAVVINAAGYTQVDQAERQADLCHLVNASAVERIAAACDRLGCLLVQLSSDYVFGRDQQRASPYEEMDEVGPLNAYGRSKLAGELAAMECRRHVIVRTCGLYSDPKSGAPSQNFVSTVLRLGRERPSIRVVHDQRCTPSYVPHVASAILALVAKEAVGCWHVVNNGDASWFEFAREVFNRAKVECDLQPIASAAYGAPAKRPGYSVLSTHKLKDAVGLAMPTWDDALSEYFLAGSFR